MIRRFLFSFSLLSLIFLFSMDSFGAPAYGTHMARKGHWSWGVEGNFVVDRNLDGDEGGTSSNRYFITGSYGLFDWLSLDGKIGVGDTEWERNTGSDLSYDTNFAGAYGFRMRVYENQEWGVKSVAGFQHISVHPNHKTQSSVKHEVILDDWQGSLLVSKEIGNLVPYLGGRYGTLDFIKWEDEAHRKRIQSEKYYGMIMGFDYWIDDRTKINLEGTVFDGEELAIGISRDF